MTATILPFRRPEPETLFTSAEAAWFWAFKQVAASAQGGKPEPHNYPYEGHQIIGCLDRLYRQRRINLSHARTLRVYAEIGQPPRPHEREQLRLWNEGISALESIMRFRGWLR